MGNANTPGPAAARQNDAPALACRADGAFHILQLTDFHNDADDALVLRTYEAVRAMIARWKPDLLAVTGDIWCSDEEPDRADERMQRDLDFLASLGVPWTFTWGNHDAMPGGFEPAQARIAAAPGALMPRGDGRGNFRIEVAGPDAQPAWDLFVLNSHERRLPVHAAEWFRDEALALTRARGKRTPALAFFHVPLRQYDAAREAGRFIGTGPEPLGEWGDDGEVLPVLLEAGCLRACFVGHSHLNDFEADWDGVRLVYGRATGYGGYGELEKGAKRIVLEANPGAMRHETVFPDGRTWRPELAQPGA